MFIVMDTRQDIGTKIRSRRRALKLSQEELAELTDVARQTVSSWERNTFAPKGPSLAALAKALRTSMDFFIEGRVDESDADRPDAGPFVWALDAPTTLELARFAQVHDHARKFAHTAPPDVRAEAVRILELTIEALRTEGQG